MFIRWELEWKTQKKNASAVPGDRRSPEIGGPRRSAVPKDRRSSEIGGPRKSAVPGDRRSSEIGGPRRSAVPGDRRSPAIGGFHWSFATGLLETASNNSKINVKITIAEKGLFYCLLCGYLCMCVCVYVPRVATRPFDVRPSNFHTITYLGSSCAFFLFHQNRSTPSGVPPQNTLKLTILRNCFCLVTMLVFLELRYSVKNFFQSLIIE